MKLFLSLLCFLWFGTCLDQGSITWGAERGGHGGSWFEDRCPGGEYVKAIAVRTGRLVDSIVIRCTNSGWMGWHGGRGGSYHHKYAAYDRFCGVTMRTGRLVDQLCFKDNSGSNFCGGGNGGNFYSEDFCSNHQKRKVLVGIRGKVGRLVDRIQFLWKETTCPTFYQLRNFQQTLGLNNQYRLQGWTNGFPHYSSIVGDRPKSIYHFTQGYGSVLLVGPQRGANRGWVNNRWKEGRTCPDSSNGNLVEYTTGSWRHTNGQFIPTDHIVGVYGKMIGYWVLDSTGNGRGNTLTRTTSFTRTHTMTQAREMEERRSFTEHFSITNSMSVELEAGFEFGALSQSAKYTAGISITAGMTNEYATAIRRSVENSWSTTTQTTTSCTVVAPDLGGAQYVAWGFEVFRADHANTGSSRTVRTCDYFFKEGPCKHIAPNCPRGACLDSECLLCVPGVNKISTISELVSRYGAIVNECVQQEVLRCAPETHQWSCCTRQNPCQIGEGDCDNDDDCYGSLRCAHNVGGVYGAVSGMDVCQESAAVIAGRLLSGEQPDVVDPATFDVPNTDEIEVETANFGENPNLTTAMENVEIAVQGCGFYDNRHQCELGGCIFYFLENDNVEEGERLFTCWDDEDCTFAEGELVECH